MEEPTMKGTSILRTLLLLLVVGSLGAWGWKTWRESRAASPTAASAASTGVLADGVTVINFHGTQRCSTCLSIGALAQSVVAEEFAADVGAGRLAWVTLDYDEPANAHFMQDYDLVSSNVVVVRHAGGKELGWSRLDEVWSLNQDEPAFKAYVKAAVDEALRPR
jgi:hypothetical protein